MSSKKNSTDVPQVKASQRTVSTAAHNVSTAPKGADNVSMPSADTEGEAIQGLHAPMGAQNVSAPAAALDNDSEHSGSLTEVILRAADAPRVIAVISDAVKKEIARVELCVLYARRRLEHFEASYNVPSSEFSERFTAEDLQGGDLEYVEWMGEYQLFQHLLQDLTLLKCFTYVAE